MKKLKWNRKCTILVLIMFISVTFASFNTNLFINGKGYVRANADIRITDIKLIESESSAYETYEPEYTKDTISINANLPKQNSTLTYQVTINNSSNYDYDIQDILEQTYSNTNISYEIVGVKKDDTVLEANTTTTFTIKLSNKTTITEEEDKYETLTYTFEYTGGEQKFVVPYDGDYTLEVWGASGGGYSSEYVGYGGYSVGKIQLKRNQKLYVYVGGEGTTNIESSESTDRLITPGWNGGGSGFVSTSFSNYSVGSGGGSTDIRTIRGNVTYQNDSYYVNDEQSLNSRIIVAGGGGGQGHNTSSPSKGSHAGGFVGNTVTSSWSDSHTHPNGGNQTSGTFGYGATPVKQSSSTHLDEGQKDRFCSGGGGGGWYGGQASIYQNCRNFGGAGGSGYIGTEKLYDKAMYCYNCQESEDISTKTISVSEVSTNPDSQKAKIGNGYAKITLTRKIEDNSDFDFDYTGGEQTFIAPYSGIYKLEVWGAQGGSTSHGTKVAVGGYGGYSMGKVKLKKDELLYINVGEKGNDSSKVDYTTKRDEVVYTEVSYNGGAPGSANGNCKWGGGGGATHIALRTGELKNLSEYKGDLIDNKYYQSTTILLVGSGGGGSGSCTNAVLRLGGAGGGINGVTGSNINYYNGMEVEESSNNCRDGGGGGTQISAGPTVYSNYLGIFGAGGYFRGSGGGSGFYGGNGSWNCGSPAGGGSGYIGNPNLYEKVMYCYNCEESQEIPTKTVTTQSHSETPKENNAKEGNGYSRITLLKRLSNNIELKLKFDFQKLPEYNITYNLNEGNLTDLKETYTRNNEDFNLPTPTKTGYTFKGWTGGLNLFQPITSYHGYTTNILNGTVVIDGDEFVFTATGKDVYFGEGDVFYAKKYDTKHCGQLMKLTGSKYISVYLTNELFTKNYIAFYDENLEKITTLSTASNKKNFQVPEGAVYATFRIGYANSQEGVEYRTKVMVAETNQINEYVPYIMTPSSITIPKGSRGNRTYNAIWEPINYNISYDLDGGTLENPVNTYNIESNDITLPSPTKDGYEFLGWTGGKNLLEIKNKSRTFGEVNFTINEDKSITINGSSGYNNNHPVGRWLYIFNNSDNKLVKDIPLNANKDYIFNGEYWEDYRVECFTTGNTNGDYFRTHKKSPIDAHMSCYVALEPNKTFNNVKLYPQLEEGTEITSYEPYISTPQSITIPKGSAGNRTYVANWKDIESPSLSLTKETYLEGFDNWTLPSGHTVENGVLSMDKSGTALSPYIETNGEKWRMEFDAYASELSVNHQDQNKGGYYARTFYYDENYERTEALNGYNHNGNSSGLNLNEWSNGISWSNYKSYGENIKYTKFGFTVGEDWAAIGGKIRNLKIYGEAIPNTFYNIIVTSSDNVEVTTTKYAKGNQNVDYFKTGGMVVTDNTIRVTENGTYTVYVSDAAGNATVKTIEITNITNAD